MNAKRIGILHPGAMGVSVAAAARQGGHTVYWASAGRSAVTAARAAEHGLTDAGNRRLSGTGSTAPATTD